MLSISITKHELPKLAFIVKLTKHFTGEKGNVKIMSLLKRHYTNWTTLYIFESFLNILNRFQSYVHVHLYIILQLLLYIFILFNIMFDSVHNMKQHICNLFLFFVDSTLWTKISMISEWATYENLTHLASGLLYKTNNRNCMHLIMCVFLIIVKSLMFE